MEGLLDRVDQVRCARIDDELIGFSRAISDGVQVALIQDLLVHPKWQRHGIGRHLLTSMMEHYSGLRQIVLLSDDIPEIVAFYESCGLHDIAREEGKPEKIIDRIVEGRLNGFYKENCLLDQPAISDDKMSVAQTLEADDGTIKRFVRFSAGE